MSAGALLAAAGCSATGGGGDAPTAPVPPDVLAVTVDGPGYDGLRIPLSCEVVDRETCAAVLDAAGMPDGPSCEALPPDPSRITITGRIEGEEVSSVLARRTTCERARHDGVLEALGL